MENNAITFSMKDGNSTTNQRIKGEFIGKHVYCGVNSMVEYILRQDDHKNAPFTYEDITNMYSYPEYYGTYVKFDGGTYDQLQQEIERLKELMQANSESEEDEIDMSIQDEIDELDNLESEPSEIYEWWMVSSFLAEKLVQYGMCVIEEENIWGRCTTGQAILLDYVITCICADMEILEGQKNSWA